MRTIQHWIFYSRAKAITSRWPDTNYADHHRAHMHFPTAT
jgi:hypothetical protein